MFGQDPAGTPMILAVVLVSLLVLWLLSMLLWFASSFWSNMWKAACLVLFVAFLVSTWENAGADGKDQTINSVKEIVHLGSQAKDHIMILLRVFLSSTSKVAVDVWGYVQSVSIALRNQPIVNPPTDRTQE